MFTLALRPNLRYHYIQNSKSALQELAHALRQRGVAGITEIIPSYQNILIEYDANVLSLTSLRRHIAAAEHSAMQGEVKGRLVTVPVRYDGEDLATLSKDLGLSVSEIIALHSGKDYDVYALGFTPGFPFLGDVDEKLRRPRRGSPRAQVPPNTVAMADFQTGIYPSATPGGWHLLGTSLSAVYDPHRNDPFLIHPGDGVRFVPSEGENPPAPKPLSLLPVAPRYPLLRVEQPGVRDLIVDGGRFGLAHFGLARSGPLDPVGASIANRLVGNASTAPLIEMHVQGPIFTALQTGVLATYGLGYEVRVNQALIEPCTSFGVRAGDVISIVLPNGGFCYLAAAGGFESSQFAGSASVDVNGHIGFPLQTDDVLGVTELRSVFPNRAFAFGRRIPTILRIPIVPGPQYNPEAIRALIAQPFVIERSSRIGVVFEGASVPGGQLPSEGNPLGAVQVTTSGKPIVLLTDRGTIGGYQKPAVVPARYLPYLSAAQPGTPVQFVRGKPGERVVSVG